MAYDEEIPLFIQFTTYLGYAILMLLGYIREGFRKVVPDPARKSPEGYAPLVRDFDDFYIRRLYLRIRDCWNRPVNTRPSRLIGVMERVSNDYNKTFKFTGKTIPCVNLSSYNYLGFAENPRSVEVEVEKAIRKYGIGPCSPALELGRSDIMAELELAVAKYVGKEAACCIGQGFATNSTCIPTLFDDDTLILSDNLNHASLVAGSRWSNAKTKVFRHNNFKQLESLIVKAIVGGKERTHRPYSRIVIVIEGIYSMEGEIVDLPKIVALKKKYNCLVYLDEAHSIGALGATGRGICEHCGVDTADIDIMMGTFTKSFGGIGGYIAADEHIVETVRRTCGANFVGEAMPPFVAAQVLGTLKVITGQDGTDIGKQRLRQLARNAKFFRQGLIEIGMKVFGDDASPVIPCMIFNPAKMPAFSRKCLERHLAVCVVGYPATGLITSRVRFCVSASHTIEDLEYALKVVDDIADDCNMRYCPKTTKGKKLK